MQNLRLGKARLSVCAPSLKSHPRFRTPGLACASDSDGAAGIGLDEWRNHMYGRLLRCTTFLMVHICENVGKLGLLALARLRIDGFWNATLFATWRKARLCNCSRPRRCHSF